MNDLADMRSYASPTPGSTTIPATVFHTLILHSLGIFVSAAGTRVLEHVCCCSIARGVFGTRVLSAA